jgi:hypothetical protein
MPIKYVKLTHKNYPYKRLLVEGELSDELEAVLPKDPDHLCGAYFCKRDGLSRWIKTYILKETKEIDYEPTVMRYIWDIEMSEDAKITDNNGKLSADTYTMCNKRFIWEDHDLCIELINDKPELLKYVQCKLSEKEYIDVVKLNGLALKYVSKKKQTIEICKTALEENPEVKEYIKIKMKKKKSNKKKN